MRLLEANLELRIEPFSLKTEKGESTFNASITFTKPNNIFGASTQVVALQGIKRIDAKAEVAQALQGLGMLEAMGVANKMETISSARSITPTAWPS